MRVRVHPVVAASIVAVTLLLTGPLTMVHAGNDEDSDADGLGSMARIEHLVVVYQENRSFDNLYGTFTGANGLKMASKVAWPSISRRVSLPTTKGMCAS